MTPAEQWRWQKFHDFHGAAEWFFGAGDDMAGGEMLFGSLTQLIIIVAMQRGEQFQEHQHRRHIIRRLAAERENPHITRNFGAAQRLHVHFYLGNLDDETGRARSIAYTRELIALLRELAVDDGCAG